MQTTLLRLALAFILTISLTNCTTAYDAYGRPQQVVDPGAALIGAAAVGLLAYSLADSDDDCHSDRSSYHHSYRGHSRYRRDYCDY